MYGAQSILTIFPPTSMFRRSTFPDSLDLTSVRVVASRVRRRPRSIVAPDFGRVLAIAVQKRTLLNVSHFGVGASGDHCQAPKGIRAQLTSQSCNSTLCTRLASAQLQKDFVAQFVLCLHVCLFAF